MNYSHFNKCGETGYVSVHHWHDQNIPTVQKYERLTVSSLRISEYPLLMLSGKFPINVLIELWLVVCYVVDRQKGTIARDAAQLVNFQLDNLQAFGVAPYFTDTVGIWRASRPGPVFTIILVKRPPPMPHDYSTLTYNFLFNLQYIQEYYYRYNKMGRRKKSEKKKLVIPKLAWRESVTSRGCSLKTVTGLLKY